MMKNFLLSCCTSSDKEEAVNEYDDTIRVYKDGVHVVPVKFTFENIECHLCFMNLKDDDGVKKACVKTFTSHVSTLLMPLSTIRFTRSENMGFIKKDWFSMNPNDDPKFLVVMHTPVNCKVDTPLLYPPIKSLSYEESFMFRHTIFHETRTSRLVCIAILPCSESRDTIAFHSHSLREFLMTAS